jgi:hypothetical protein
LRWHSHCLKWNQFQPVVIYYNNYPVSERNNLRALMQLAAAHWTSVLGAEHLLTILPRELLTFIHFEFARAEQRGAFDRRKRTFFVVAKELIPDCIEMPRTPCSVLTLIQLIPGAFVGRNEQSGVTHAANFE